VKTVEIGGRLVGEGQPCFMIAEAGVNHNGEVALAHRLIDGAVRAGADAVKFQKRSVTDILVRAALEAPYVKPNSLGPTYGEHRERLELSEEAYRELVDHCRKDGIIFLASAWDPRSADFIDELGTPAFKIASADVTNLPLVDHLARKGKPVLLSTGMSDMEEIADAVATVRRHHDRLVLLQCTSSYPCDNADVNLRAMDTLRRAFEAPVGYSGHERGLAPTEAAVALGAVVVERHFTLDRTLPGPDHAASLEPRGLELLVRNIRNVEAALGSAEKRPAPAERPVRERLAKSVAAARPIRAGSVIRAEDLTVKGPGTGISPRFLHRVVGRVAEKDVPEDTLVPLEALSWR
jgi:sialic acid synthase SpsE